MISHILRRGKTRVFEEEGEKKRDTRLEVQTSDSSYQSYHPTLTPLESPFIDGHRYRLAQATELRTRLDLYVEDEGGPWLRKHGVLIAAAGGRGIKS